MAAPSFITTTTPLFITSYRPPSICPLLPRCAATPPSSTSPLPSSPPPHLPPPILNPSETDLIPVPRSIVWFREGDLHIRDHPGLQAACDNTTTSLAPLFICTPQTPAETLTAAQSLHSALSTRDSLLYIRFTTGDPIDALLSFLSEFPADRLHLRADVDETSRAFLDRLTRCLPPATAVHAWEYDLRDWRQVEDDVDYVNSMPEAFTDFLKWSIRNRLPIPSVSNTTNSNQSENNDTLQFVPPLPDTLRREDTTTTLQSITTQIAKTPPTLPLWRRKFPHRFQTELDLTRTPHPPPLPTQAIATFLQRAEGYEQPDCARSLRDVLQQGTVTPRQMYRAVLQFERHNGRLFRPLFRDAAKTLLSYLDAREFHTMLARRDVRAGRTVDGEHTAKFWRWNGVLIRYVEEGRSTMYYREQRPAILLVHGFGASVFHWRKSVRMLREKYHVFAVDLVGFGRSEKPPMQYTATVWEEMLWDFVVQVVGKPVYVAGNSIGGYLACMLGSDGYGPICSGICLLNSAGSLKTQSPNEDKSSQPTGTKYYLREWKWLRMTIGRLLLRNLQGRIVKTLNAVYPIHPLKEGDGLAEEIARDSKDFGAVDVIASGLILPEGRSLREGLEGFAGPLLVFNGVLDPLGNVAERTETIQSICPQARVVKVQAGHCPHDEVAEEFVEVFSKWVDDCEAEHDGVVESSEADEAKVDAVGLG